MICLFGYIGESSYLSPHNRAKRATKKFTEKVIINFLNRLRDY